MNSATRFFSLLILCFFASSCGNGNSNTIETDKHTYFRFFNAVPDASGVDLLIDEKTVQPNVGYLEGTGYFRTRTENRAIRVTVTNTFQSLFDRTTSLADRKDQTLIVYGPVNKARSSLISDDNTGPGSSLARIRTLHLANSAKQVDLYISKSGTPAVGIAPTLENLSYGTVSPYLTSQTGSYTINVTQPNSNLSVAQLPDQTFSGDSVYSVLIVDTAPGKLPVRIIVLKDR